MRRLDVNRANQLLGNSLHPREALLQPIRDLVPQLAGNLAQIVTMIDLGYNLKRKRKKQPLS